MAGCWLRSPAIRRCDAGLKPRRHGYSCGGGPSGPQTMTKLADATASAFDVERVREDFPILAETIHGRRLVYLDNANTTQKPRQVLEALDQYYLHANANIHRATHLLSERATEAYEATRAVVKRFINAGGTREVVFTKGCTEG